MASRAERATVNAAGLVQGIALVTFPAASTIFTFVLIASLPRNAPAAAVAAFGLAGLGCSALLPLTISFGQEKLTGRPAVVAGGVIACYQVGYGIAAFGVGPLASAGVRLTTIFAASAAVAAAMGVLSLAVARGRPSPATVHPRPAGPRPWRSAAGTGAAGTGAAGTGAAGTGAAGTGAAGTGKAAA